jgi:hypothetical protein
MSSIRASETLAILPARVSKEINSFGLGPQSPFASLVCLIPKLIIELILNDRKSNK